MSSANFKCIPLLNLLRFQGGELEERVFDAKFQDFMAAAKSDLEKAQTQKAKALIYHATISAQLAFLERKGVEATAMQNLALEVEGRVSGKQIDFVFDLPTATNAKTMADEKHRAKVLALYIAQPKERQRLYKFSPRYADLDEGQIKDLLKNFNRNRSGDKIFQGLVEHYQRLAMEDTFDFSEYFDSP
jgi:hypothetical protein